MRKNSVVSKFFEDSRRGYTAASVVVMAWFLALSVVLAAINSAIWADEALALTFAQGSFSDLIEIMRYDSHPPFHFLALRLWGSVFGHSLFSMKIVSVIPGFLTVLCGFLFLRKEVSPRAALTFALCCAASRSVLYYNIEVRNYSWALFFVTMSAICAWYIITSDRTAPFLGFLLFAEGAAYTHYYAAAAVFIGYFFLLYYVARYDRKKTLKILALIPLAIVLYLPWLPIMIESYALMDQYSLVAWYTKPGLRDIASYVYLIFAVGFKPASLLYLALFCMAFFGFFRLKNKDRRDYFAAASLACLVILAVVTFTVSVVYKPMLVARYLFPAFGLLWLFFSMVIEKVITGSRFVLLPLAVFSLVSAFTLTRAEYTENKDFNDLFGFLSSNVQADDVIIISPSESHYVQIMAYLFQDHDEVVSSRVLNPKRDGMTKITRTNMITYAALSDSTRFNGRTGWVIVSDTEIARDALPHGTGARFVGDFGWSEYKLKLYQTTNFSALSTWE
jgi:uncharacterized membrane protein